MNDQLPWTVLRLLQWTTDFLQQHGSQSARLDAEVLLAKAMDCQRIDLYTSFDHVASQDVRDVFRSFVKRRADGMPVAYLVGEKEFYSRSFAITPDVLVPRPETEFVVVELLDLIPDQRRDAAMRILDVGTGSGILAICAAAELPQAVVTAVDISSAALDVAIRNAVRHAVDGRIAFVESDLFAAVPADSAFDFIISNPPYISLAEFEQLDRSVKDHEPTTALVAGQQGTEVIARIIEDSTKRLAPGGWLIVEISPAIADAVVDLFDSQPDFESASVRMDLAQRPRVVKAQRV
jgi:release factor glutamine methyltransferase